MSPANAEVYHFEDDPDQIEVVGIFLRIHGHNIRETANSVRTALDIIPRIPAGAVVIQDGNLGTSRLGEDGQRVVDEIRMQHGDTVIIIAHTGDGSSFDRANFNSPKTDGAQALARIVTAA